MLLLSDANCYLVIMGLSGGRTVIGAVRFEGKVHVMDAVLGGANITHILVNALPLQTTSIASTFIFEAPVKVSRFELQKGIGSFNEV